MELCLIDGLTKQGGRRRIILTCLCYVKERERERNLAAKEGGTIKPLRHHIDRAVAVL